MPTAPARIAERTTIDERSILIRLEHPIIGTDYAGPHREPSRFTIDQVVIHAVRAVEKDTGWVLGVVETKGQHLVDGDPTGLAARREYHPDYMNRCHHHADMPTELARLVHDETSGEVEE